MQENNTAQILQLVGGLFLSIGEPITATRVVVGIEKLDCTLIVGKGRLWVRWIVLTNVIYL